MVKNKKPRIKHQNKSITRNTGAKPDNSITAVEQKAFSGPIPPPDILEAYKKINPEIPEKIIHNFLQESHHRREFEKRSLEANVEISQKNSAQKTRGQYLGFIITIAGFLTAGLVSIIGHDAETASLIGGGTLVSLVAVFVTGRYIGKN